MSRELVYLPVVRLDFVEGFRYYETLSPGRGGARFESAFRWALQQVEEARITHFKAFGDFHRVILPRFPYNLYYWFVEEKAIVTALLYARFDPKRIEAMLKKRT